MARSDIGLLAARISFVIACAMTLTAALTPPNDHPLHLLPWEKGDHMLAFYVLSLLGAVAAPRLPLYAVGAVLAGLGGSIEIMQALPAVNRDPRFVDFLIDLGAILVALLPMAFGRWRMALREAEAEAALLANEPGLAGSARDL